MVRRITRVAVVISFCMISGMALKFLPNVKPSTAFVILFSVYYSLIEGLLLSVGLTLTQALLFGFGTFVPFQIIAWTIISILAYLLRKVLSENKILLVIFAIISGLIYGLVISFDILLMFGLKVFIPYYLNGLMFDLLHIVGNVVFILILQVCILRMKAIFNE